jgi:hypothetical protein
LYAQLAKLKKITSDSKRQSVLNFVLEIQLYPCTSQYIIRVTNFFIIERCLKNLAVTAGYGRSGQYVRRVGGQRLPQDFSGNAQ